MSFIPLNKDEHHAQMIHDCLWRKVSIYREMWNGFDTKQGYIVSKFKKHNDIRAYSLKDIENAIDRMMLIVDIYNDTISNEKAFVEGRYIFTAPMTVIKEGLK